MKITFVVLGAVCLLLVAIVLIGSRLPKRHVVALSATYAEKPERLFDFVSGSQAWRSDVKQETRMKSSTGMLVSLETDRRGRTITYELLDIDPPRRMTRRIADRNLPYGGSWTYVLQADGTGTKVTIAEDGEIYNPVFRFVSRFVIGQTKTMTTYLVDLGKATGESITPK